MIMERTRCKIEEAGFSFEWIPLFLSELKPVS